MKKHFLAVFAFVTLIATFLLLGSFPAAALIPPGWMFHHASSQTGKDLPLLIWAAVVASPALAGKILAIAGVVFALLQALKKVLPIGGMGSVIFNVILSAVGVLVVVQPDAFFSLATVRDVLLAAIAAAGAHGTWRSFNPPAESPPLN